MIEYGFHGHEYKLYKPYFKLESRKFFSIRVVDVCNLLRESFYRAMHFSAKRGIAIACRLSVCL